MVPARTIARWRRGPAGPEPARVSLLESGRRPPYGGFATQSLWRGKARHDAVPARRPEPHRHLGPEAGSSLEYSRRIQADQDKGRWHSGQRDDADARRSDG